MFTLLKGLALGNPWGSAILLVVLIGAGFSAGVWLDSLMKNASISKLKLDAATLQIQLAQAKSDALLSVRAKEKTLDARQSEVEKWYQQQLTEQGKTHEKELNTVRQFAKDHPERDYALPAGTGLDWVHEQPGSGDLAAKPNLSGTAGAVADVNAGATQCKLSDLLLDRDNYKDALSRCAEQVRGLQKVLLGWRATINAVAK